MGTYNIILTKTGKCVGTSKELKIMNKALAHPTIQEKCHIEIIDKIRGHVCNAVYSVSAKTWVLQKIG